MTLSLKNRRLIEGGRLIAGAVMLMAPLAACSTTHETVYEEQRAAALDNRGAYLEDQAIASKVAAALTSEPRFRQADIHVGTIDNMVTLSGYVRNGSDIGYAEDLAMNVGGVRGVHNVLVVR